jgi:hypothetical protein
MARDFQAPRSFLRIGDRLTFSHGIIALSITAAAIYAAFHGNTEALIPLYAVGVFLAFTMSQSGMVVHWWRNRDEPHWRRSLAFNAMGAVLSGLVFITAAVTKFAAGAWVAVLAIGLVIAIALRIRRHYDRARRQLTLHPFEGTAPAGAADQDDAEREEHPQQIKNLTIVPVVGLDLADMRALAYAAALSQPVLALHVSPTHAEAARFRSYWQAWGNHLPLEVIVSPHRALLAPMVHYLWSLRRQRPDLTLTVVLAEIVVRHWWQRPLHNHVAPRLRRTLRPLPKVVVTTVPFHLAR